MLGSASSVVGLPLRENDVDIDDSASAGFSGGRFYKFRAPGADSF
jgi:hypothetical protein